MEHYICRAVTELLGYMQTKFIVPEGDILNVGQVFVANNMSEEINRQLQCFYSRLIDDVTKEIPAIIINNEFEVLPDGRRPDGNPDYTQYDYLPAGISNNDSFQISGNTVLTKGEISALGSYAVMVRGTDAKGNIKNSITTAFNIAAE